MLIIKEIIKIFKIKSSLISKIILLVWNCNKKLVLIIFFGTIFSSLLPFTQTIISKYVLDSIISAVTHFHSALSTQNSALWFYLRPILFFVGLEFILVALSRNLSLFIELQREILGELFSKDTSVHIIRKAVSLDLSYFEDAEYYDKLQKAQRDGNYRPVQLLNQMFTLLENTVSIGSFFTLLLLFKWYFLFLIILATAPSTYTQFRFANKKYSLINNRTPEQRKAYYFSSLLSNNVFIKEIKLFQLGSYFLDKYVTVITKFFNENKRLAVQRTRANVFSNIVSLLSSYGAYGLIIYNTIINTITIGSMTMYYQAFSRSQAALDSFLRTIAGLYENMLYVSNYVEFMRIQSVIENQSDKGDGEEVRSQKPEVRMKTVNELWSLGVESAEYKVKESESRESNNNEQLVINNFTIVFNNVSFSYPGNGKMVLKDVNFEINQGQMVALVGENGAGKTTIVKLLARLYDPTEGEIWIRENNLKDFPVEFIRRNISVVFQDFNHYQMLVKENIGVGDVKEIENINKIYDVASLTGVDKFIHTLPSGYDTQLGRWFEKGQELSIGQWQRIALARGFIRDAPILIFDEPTSHLDARAEAEIFDALEKFRRDKIVIIVSHRLKTVRTADKIIVLQKGTIIEDGTHDELMGKKGLYHQLFSLQAEGYQK